MAGAQQNTTVIAPVAGTLLSGMNFPGTVVGFKWFLNACIEGAAAATTGVVPIAWAIVRLRQGNQVGSTDIASNGDTYYPTEQDVMASGSFLLLPGHVSQTPCEGQTKTMRKLMAGDKIVFTWEAYNPYQAGTTAKIFGQIQYFYKT